MFKSFRCTYSLWHPPKEITLFLLIADTVWNLFALKHSELRITSFYQFKVSKSNAKMSFISVLYASPPTTIIYLLTKQHAWYVRGSGNSDPSCNFTLETTVIGYVFIY